MEREDITGQLKAMKAAGEDISFTGLRRSGRESLLGAALREFGKYQKAVEAAGIDYLAVVHTKPKGYWDSIENLRKEIGAVARRLGKPVVALTTGDLNANGLGGVLHKFDDRPMLLFRFIGCSSEELRDRRRTKGHWRSKRNRVEAVREVLKRSGKGYEALVSDDFRELGVGGLIDYVLSARKWSLFRLFREAGFKGQPWQLKRVGKMWASRRERCKAIRWLVAKAKKDYHELTQEDFHRNGLAGMMVTYYADSPFRALRDAGFKIDPLRFPLLPDGYWDDPRNQRAALRRLMQRIGKRRIEEITTDDIRAAGLNSLYKKHGTIAGLLQAIGGRRFDASMLQPGRSRHQSNHGHLFRSDGERKLDDILYEKFGFKGHKHNYKYPGGRGRKQKNCDFVTDDLSFWVEYAGMLGPHPRGNRIAIQKEYRRKLRVKQRIARLHGLKLVVVYPKDLHNERRLENKLLRFGIVPALDMR